MLELAPMLELDPRPHDSNYQELDVLTSARSWRAATQHASDAMFSDHCKPHSWKFFEASGGSDDGTRAQTGEERPSASVKLNVNAFRLVFETIYHYRYSIEGPAAQSAKENLEEEKKMLERAWRDLEKHLEVFCVRLPGHIFSPRKSDQFKISLDGGEIIMIVSLDKTPEAELSVGAASVVPQHVVNQMAVARMARKVGRRWYVADAAKGSLNMMHSMKVLPSGLGPLLQIDLKPQPVYERTIIEVLKNCMPGTDIFAHQLDKEIKNEWLKCCVSATVVTAYNSRVYKIKGVHFDMTPKSNFQMRGKGGEANLQISLKDYLQAFYDCDVKYDSQPVLEAFPDKPKEQVLLLPEHCHLTGIDEETLNHKTRLMETLKRLRASPQERYDATLQHVAKLKDQEICKKWNCQLKESPLQVEGRALDRWYVSFEEGQRFPVDEEGTFIRWLRHGLQDPQEIENWLLIYPEIDEPVLDIWIGSLRATAKSGFNMTLGEPSRHLCSDQRLELKELLQKLVTPHTQFVMLLTPSNESWKVYRLFKEVMCCEMAMPSQVVKSETIRKRQSTGVILGKIVQQMNAKHWGSLWHILPEEKESPEFEEFYAKPVMVLGINVFQTSSGKRWLGLVASLNRACSQFYSMAKECVEDAEKSLSLQLQQLFREALGAFAEDNDGQLPQRLVIYRAFVDPSDFPALDQVEFKSMQAVVDMAPAGEGCTVSYDPEITYIAVAKKDDMRIFTLRPDAANIGNPEAGIVVDDVRLSGTFPSFYAVNQATSRGTAVPAHFTVLKPGNMSLEFIQQLTYRLSLLYFNCNSSVRLPAPVMYARRMTEFIGTVLRQEPDIRLSKTLFYL